MSSSSRDAAFPVRPVTDAHRALYEEPSIASQMPVSFKNGARWDSVDGFCPCCKSPVPADQLRGRVWRPNDHLVEIDAMGLCSPCRMLIPFRYRLHDDLSLSGVLKGQWQRWRAQPSAWARVKKWLRTLLSSSAL